MSDDEIIKLMLENDKLKEAITRIAQFDADSRSGFVDEWEEAWAFKECQKIARTAINDMPNL